MRQPVASPRHAWPLLDRRSAPAAAPQHPSPTLDHAARAGLLHLLTRLSGKRRAQQQQQQRGISALEAAKETLRYTAFLGCMAGVYVGADEAIAALWGKERTASWRALVAGALAGPSLLLTG